MRILVIEDNKLKAQDIRKSLEKQYPNVVIEESYAYASGVRKAYKEKYDAANEHCSPIHVSCAGY